MAYDEVAVAASVFDEQPVGIVATGDYAGEIAARHRRGHAGLVVCRHPGGWVDRTSNPLSQAGIRVITRHGQYGIGRKDLDRAGG
jgi:hypothetical protein